MARILIGWEIGGGHGHIERIMAHRTALEARGHVVRVALRRPDPSLPDAIPAPIWHSGRRPATPPRSLGDVLASMGGDVPGVFASVVQGWREIMTRERPDAVIADFAPGLLTAARGRVRSILIGNGYDCPPADMESFPAIAGGVPGSEDAVRRAIGVDRLPSIFHADHVVVGAIPWMDPYAALRPGEHKVPLARSRGAGDGREIVVYMTRGEPRGFDDALAAIGLPVVRVGRDRRLTWEEIAGRAEMVISHGGCGFVTQAVLAGIPQMILYPDLEKAYYGQETSRRGLGWAGASHGFDASSFVETARRLHDDVVIRKTCRLESDRLRQDRRDSVAFVAEILNVT